MVYVCVVITPENVDFLLLFVMLFIPICFRWPESFCEMCMCRWACLLPISERPNFKKKGAIYGVRFAKSRSAKRKSRFRQEFWNQSSIVDYNFEWWYFVVMIRLKPICSNLQKRSMRGEEKLNRMRKLKRKRKQLQLLLELNRFHLSSSSFSLISDQVGSRG